MATKYINLRFHFGGILVSDVRSVYIRGNKEYAFNIDMDYLSIPKVKDSCRNFGISNIYKIYIVVPNGRGLLELAKDRDLLLLSDLLANRGTMDIYICHTEKIFIKNTHVSNESFETTCGVGDPNKDSINKVGEGLNTPLGKEIELIDGSGQIQGVQTSNMIGKSTGNIDELEDEFGLSNKEEDSDEDLDEDDVEPTVHDEIEEDENIDLSGDEDGYGSDVHEELNIVKTDLKVYIKKKREPRKKRNSEYFLGPVGIDPGFEDIDRPRKNLSGKLLPDEPFYDSLDQHSFDSESEGESHIDRSEILRAKKNNKRTPYDPT
ncbi:hypothetical protein HAX54_028723 [Datura stramonium]|uniref:PB1-like domain-containing protein n=1 Tax=Datura stramonium TaxID=4076 RepID=A0ABS8V4K6_DATST|nr:hypothetical protein [Datura stramonium]